MNHPNIAKVLDAGATETGRPYFVMELVKGASITDFCDANNLSTHERLNLFVQVCQAVQHAHQKGIIHRDLKPTNVMVMLHDDVPVPTVIDFGIAKATAQRLTEKTVFTRFAQMIGTPEYMSPEQAKFSGLDIDTRSDIYSLGVLLYELLTGATPFNAQILRQAGYAEIQRIIREEEPDKPSTKLNTLGEALTDIARHRHTEPNSLTKLIKGDLDWIVMKTLQKDRSRRYETATELGMDIERYLGSEPVLAGAPTVAYKLDKFIRRHRVGVTVGLLLAITIVTGFVTTSIMYFQADSALEQSQYWLYVSNIKAAQNAIEHPVIASPKDYLNRCPKEFRHWEWRRLNWLADRSIRTFRGYEGCSVHSVTFSPDNEYIFLTGTDNRTKDRIAKVCDANTGVELVTLSGKKDDIGSAAFSPDGKQIILTGRNILKVYDAVTGDLKTSFNTHSITGKINITSIALSPDGKRIAAVSTGIWGSSNLGNRRFFDPIKVFDVSTGKGLLTLTGHEDFVFTATFSPDGQRIVSGSNDKTVRIWDASTGEELMILGGHKSEVTSVIYSPDGKRIASGSKDKTVRLWDVDTGTELITFRGHEGEVSSIAFSPNNKRIVSSSYDKTIRMWDATTGKEFMTFLGHGHAITSAAFSLDGKYIVSGDCDGIIKVWDTDTAKEPMILGGHESPPNSLVFSPDSKRIVSGSYDNTIRLWDTNSGEELMKLGADKEAVSSVDFSPDGKRVVSGVGKTVRIWDVDTGDELMKLENEKKITSVAFSPDGKTIISGGWEKNIKIWDAATGAALSNIRGHEECVTSVAFSPDGQRIISCSDSDIKMWDIVTRKELFSILRNGEKNVQQPTLAVSPDGKRIVSGILNYKAFKIKLRDAITGKELFPFSKYEGRVAVSFAFSPDGDRIVSGGLGDITIWDTATGEELINLSGHEGIVTVIAFSPDGRYISSADESNVIRIWRCNP